MVLTKLWNRLACSNHLRDIWPAEQFAAILDREMALARRYDSEFSLVVFSGVHMERIEDRKEALLRRIRSTDEIGWLDEQRIGIILPDTSMEGAQKLADDISAQLSTPESPLSCRAYTYPSQWLSVHSVRSVVSL